MPIKCYCCGEEGHGSNNCPNKDKIPRSDWYVNKVMTNLQNDQRTDASEDKNADRVSIKSNTTNKSNVEGWCSFQHATTTEAQFNQYDDKFLHLKNKIILDMGSTILATL